MSEKIEKANDAAVETCRATIEDKCHPYQLISPENFDSRHQIYKF